MFKAFNQEYVIIEAFLDAYVDDEKLIWGFEVEAKSKTNSDGTFPEIIKISTHECPLFSSNKGEIDSWLDIAGKKINILDAYGEEEPDVSVYIDEHVPLYTGEFSVEKNENSLQLKLIGKCDSGWGEKAQITVVTPLEFKGVLCGRSSKDDSLKSISQFLNPDNFVYKKDNNGVSSLEPKINNAT